VRSPPGGDALDDEELFSGSHVADPPCFATRRLGARREGESLLETILRLPERLHLGARLGEVGSSLEVRRERPVVEEDGDGEEPGDPGESKPARPDDRPPCRARPASPLRPGPPCGPRWHAATFPLARRSPASRYAVSTLMTFVEPGMFTAVPAVSTTRSPDSTMPASRAASIEWRQRSSTSIDSGISRGVTPHSIAMC